MTARTLIHVTPTSSPRVRVARDTKTVYVTIDNVELYGDPEDVARWLTEATRELRERVAVERSST